MLLTLMVNLLILGVYVGGWDVFQESIPLYMYARRLPKPSERGVLKHRRRGDRHGLKVLIVTTDTRDVGDELFNDDYVSKASVLLNNYAFVNGYDYLKVTPNVTELTRYVKHFFCNGNPMPEPDLCFIGDDVGSKYSKTSFHPGLMQYRTSSWTKLPQLWYVAKEYGKDYDYIWFFDSDATINPLFRNLSLSDAFIDWQSHKEKILWGPEKISDAIFVFFSNFPWRDDLPCAGNFLFKPEKAEPLLREWWDYNIPEKNYNDFMEQDALWLMLDAPPELGFLVNKSSVSLVSIPQFVSKWHGLKDLWITHLPTYNYNRNVYLRILLRDAHLYDKDAFRTAAHRIMKHATIHLNIFAACVAMDRCSAVAAEGDSRYVGLGEGKRAFDCGRSSVFDVDNSSLFVRPTPRRKFYPGVPMQAGGREHAGWHAPHYSSRPPTPPLASLFEGMLISLYEDKSNISVVRGGVRYKVPAPLNPEQIPFVLYFKTVDEENTIPFAK